MTTKLTVSDHTYAKTVAKNPEMAQFLKIGNGNQKPRLVQSVEPKAERSKYGNRKTEIDGIVFDSKREARRYTILKAMLSAGEISDLKCQPKFELQPAYTRRGKKVRAITYKPDFSYIRTADGAHVVEDVKSSDGKATITQASRLRMKMFEYKYPEIELLIV